jgi:hypothetical protein
VARYTILDYQASQVIPATSGPGEPILIYNEGPYPVYLATDTSISLDPTANGTKVPAQAYKEWPGNSPLFAMCAPTQTTVIVVVPQQAGPVIPPIGQVCVPISSARGQNLLSNTIGPFDMTRFDSFSFMFRENGNIGTDYRIVNMYWTTSNSSDVSTLTSFDFVVEVETHIVFCEGGYFNLSGRVKAPYLYIDMLSSNGGASTIRGWLLSGYLNPIVDNGRIDKYTNFNVVSGVLAPSQGTITADGTQRHWTWAVGSLATATSATAYIKTSFGGPATLTVRAGAALTTSTYTVSLSDPAGNDIIVLDLPPTTTPRSSLTIPFYMPPGCPKVTVSNNSAGTVATGNVEINMLGHL